MKKIPSITKGVYRHTKTGKEYEVIGTALQTETEEILVIYRPLYRNVNHQLYARPYGMFKEIVTIDGKSMPRFEKVNTPRSYIA